jgi:hypothetical protein
MDAGALVEQGTHAELLARGGHYARLVAAQVRDGNADAYRAARPALTPVGGAGRRAQDLADARRVRPPLGTRRAGYAEALVAAGAGPELDPDGPTWNLRRTR